LKSKKNTTENGDSRPSTSQGSGLHSRNKNKTNDTRKSGDTLLGDPSQPTGNKADTLQRELLLSAQYRSYLSHTEHLPAKEFTENRV